MRSPSHLILAAVASCAALACAPSLAGGGGPDTSREARVAAAREDRDLGVLERQKPGSGDLPCPSAVAGAPIAICWASTWRSSRTTSGPGGRSRGGPRRCGRRDARTSFPRSSFRMTRSFALSALARTTSISAANTEWIPVEASHTKTTAASGATAPPFHLATCPAARRRGRATPETWSPSIMTARSARGGHVLAPAGLCSCAFRVWFSRDMDATTARAAPERHREACFRFARMRFLQRTWEGGRAAPGLRGDLLRAVRGRFDSKPPACRRE
jgi:hypothetical protein